MDRSERTDKLLNIIDRLLGIIEYEQLCDALECDDSDEDENGKPQWLIEVEEFKKSWKPLSEVWWFKYDEEDEEDDYKDCRSHINKDWLPENNLVKCIWVDEDGNWIYKFK